MLRATTACTFSTSQLPNVVRRWCASYVLTSKCASGHNGVQLFISHLTTWLCTRRFSEPTFRPSGATNHWKSTVFRDFPTFSHTWTTFFRRLFLSSFFFLLASCFLLLASCFLLLASCFLHLSSLLFSSLLCFASVHFVIYCRKFDFEPSFDHVNLPYGSSEL